MELFVVSGRPESSLSDDVVTPFNSKLFPLFNWCCECDMAGGEISMAACLTRRWWFDGNVVLIELLLALPTALVFITFEPYSVDNNCCSWLFNFAISRMVKFFVECVSFVYIVACVSVCFFFSVFSLYYFCLLFGVRAFVFPLCIFKSVFMVASTFPLPIYFRFLHSCIYT